MKTTFRALLVASALILPIGGAYADDLNPCEVGENCPPVDDMNKMRSGVDMSKNMHQMTQKNKNKVMKQNMGDMHKDMSEMMGDMSKNMQMMDEKMQMMMQESMDQRMKQNMHDMHKDMSEMMQQMQQMQQMHNKMSGMMQHGVSGKTKSAATSSGNGAKDHEKHHPVQ